MGALFALIPSNWKFGLEGLAALAVAGYISWFLHHERQIGRDEITAGQVKLVAAQQVTNAKIEALAQSRIDAALAKYRTSMAAPVVNPVHVSVCNHSGSGTLSAHASSGAGPNGIADVSEAVGPVHADADIGPYTDNLLDAAEDQIGYLQDYIKACQEKGICLR